MDKAKILEDVGSPLATDVYYILEELRSLEEG